SRLEVAPGSGEEPACGHVGARWYLWLPLDPASPPSGPIEPPDLGGRYGARAMTRLLLIRHGESIWNADGRWQAQADPALTDRGREQARAAAASIGHVDAVVTSDLERAAETGAIIARLLGVDHVAQEPRLRERDAGSLSGLTRVDIFDRFPGLLHDDPA